MEVSKLEMNQSLGSSYLTAHSEKLPYPLVSKWPELIIHFYYGKNKEPLTHLMDFPFGPIHSSETPHLTINYVTPAHQINIQQLIL